MINRRNLLISSSIAAGTWLLPKPLWSVTTRPASSSKSIDRKTLVDQFAMTAARLGEGELAIAALLIDSPKNRWHPNRHVYQRPNLTAYLSAYGGLLAAIALMATQPNGFPSNKTWNPRSEGLSTLL